MITFSNCAKPINDADLDALEQQLRYSLPLDFRSHYIDCNGGISNRQGYCMKKYDTYLLVGPFVPIKFLSSSSARTILEKYTLFREKDILSDYYLPFCADLGSNQICIDLRTGKIYIIFMDLGDPMQEAEAVRLIANSFEIFINGLEEPEEEEV